MKILLVEDEVALAEALSEILKRNKYSVDMVHDGEDGLEYALTDLYDCIILDIMLPKMNGIDVLRLLRKKHINTPVLLLTAKSEVEDKINGLDSGADDFLTKPFVSGELLARVRALTRRRGEVVTDEFTFGDIALNKSTFSLSREGQFVKLSLKEYQIIEMMMVNPKQLIPKERFIEKIWGYESDVEYNNVEVYISFLRKKLGAIGSGVTIKTARGIGYYLEGGD
ncbi:MAG: response regulator transcription factor [Oscillospiraceae bacterium]|nr:response regulator transcription factor [Oscillospiraceae bacterium]